MANGILLCRYHQDVVHRRGTEICRRGNRWVFADASGQEIIDPRPDGDSAT